MGSPRLSTALVLLWRLGGTRLDGARARQRGATPDTSARDPRWRPLRRRRRPLPARRATAAAAPMRAAAGTF